MNTKQILEIVLKLFGVYLLILVLNNLTGVLDSLTWFIDSSSGDKKKGVIIFLSRISRVIIYFIGSKYFIFKPNLIIKILKINNLDNQEISTLNNTKLQITLFQTSGIIILFFSIDSIISAIFLSNMVSVDIADAYSNNLKLFYLAPPIFKILLGLSLLFFPRLITKIISKK